MTGDVYLLTNDWIGDVYLLTNDWRCYLLTSESDAHLLSKE